MNDRDQCLQATVEAPGSTFSGWGLGSALPSGPEPGVLPVLGPPSEWPPSRQGPHVGLCVIRPPPRLTLRPHWIYTSPLAPFPRGLSSQLCTLPKRWKRPPLHAPAACGTPAAPMSPRRTGPWTPRSASAGRALTDASAGGGAGGRDPGASGGQGSLRRGPLPGGPRARTSRLL